MKILNVRLDGFGQFNRGLEVAFNPRGLTVLVGKNEAGKSTLLAAVTSILFGFKDLNLTRRFEPWDEYERFGGEIELESDDGRRLAVGRDFKTQTAWIAELVEGDRRSLFDGSADPRGNTSDDHEYFTILGELLGFQDETVFRNTVFFGQQNLQTQVSEQIRRLLTGSADLDYKGALHELHSRYADLTTENPWKARDNSRQRLIEQTRSALADDRDRWTEGRETLVRTMELEAELESLEDGLAQLECDLEEATARATVHEELFNLLGRRDAARKHYEEALGRRDNLKRYTDRTDEIERIISQGFSEFRTAPSDLSDLLRIHAAETEEIERDDAQLTEEKKRLEELRPEPNASLGWFLGVLALGIGMALGALTALGVPAGSILGVVGGIIACAVGRSIGTGYAEAKAAIEQRTLTLEETLGRRQRRIEDIRDRTGTLLVGQKVEQVAERYGRFRDLREETKRLGAALKALGGRGDVQKSFEEAAREQGAVEAGIERIVAEHPDLAGQEDRGQLGAALQVLKGRAEGLRDQLRQDRSRIEHHRVELAGLSARMDFDLAMLEEGIRDKQIRLERLDLEREALKEAIDTLDGCVADFQEGDVFRLGEEISEIFSRITEDKYTHVHLGSSMDPVISRGDSVPIAPADLSQGARDQLYFAMRIAMARHLSRNVRLPLFLDDPFVNFDDERLRVTRDVIRHLDDHQVVLVTCDKGYENWGDRVIDLDALKRQRVA